MKNKKLKFTNGIARVFLVYATIGGLSWGMSSLCQAQTPPADFTPALQHVVNLTKGGMDDDFILIYITNSGTSYALSDDDMIYLHKQGVSDTVIKAMMQAAPPATPTQNPAPNTVSSSPAPPPIEAPDDNSSPSTAVSSPDAASSGSPTPPAVDVGGAPVQTAGLQDNFSADLGLNPSVWWAQSSVLTSLASMSGPQVIPALAFSQSGMQMSGISGPGQFMGVQTTASFEAPFTFSATVAGMAQRAVPFEIYLVSADLQQWISLAGHLGGHAAGGGIHLGVGDLFHVTIPGTADAPDYGVWINHTGNGWPISALGNRFFNTPIAGVPYTIQISVDANGTASVSLSDPSSGAVLASEDGVPVGTGPFYVVLAGRDGPTFANWQSVQVASPAPMVAEAPVTPPTPTLDYFQAQLAPYGNWVDVPGYGTCWQPAVGDSWRPYYDGGHWEYTDAGWFWQSDYPWGDIAFHYGRWVYASFGDDPSWVWVPGYDYAPAWVVWRHDDDDGYIGWAPLPPGAVFVNGGWAFNGVAVGVDFAFGLGDGFFSYVDYGHLFFDPHMYHDGYRHFYVPHDRLALIYRHSVIENHYRLDDHGRFVNEGLAHDRMVALTHRDIETRDMHDLKQSEEQRNAIARNDDVHSFKPGTTKPNAMRVTPSNPGFNHNEPGIKPTQQPERFGSNPETTPARNQTYSGFGNDEQSSAKNNGGSFGSGQRSTTSSGGSQNSKPASSSSGNSSSNNSKKKTD